MARLQCVTDRAACMAEKTLQPVSTAYAPLRGRLPERVEMGITPHGYYLEWYGKTYSDANARHITQAVLRDTMADLLDMASRRGVSDTGAEALADAIGKALDSLSPEDT